MNIRKTTNSLLVLAMVFAFSACGPTKLLLNTYSPPNKQKEVKQMLESEDSKSGFLELEIVDTVLKAKNVKSDKDFDNKLLSSLKKYITQTNFIAVSSVADQSAMSLDMKVLIFDYKQDANSIKGTIAVEFNIRKEGTVFYTQNYKYVFSRYSKAGLQGINKGMILSQASDYLAKKLIKDISPIATQKLVELKPLPSEIEYTITYAKAKNFKGAIKGMKNYKGEKTAAYYYNLAVYYEALASQSDSLELLTKADEYYEQAMALSQGKDETIVKGKAKFDNYYNIIKKVAHQKKINAQNSSNDNFELLD
jgi:hypothetical protein